MKVFKVRVNKDVMPEVVDAIASGDSDALSKSLDELIVFEGAAGAVIDRADDGVFDELADALVGLKLG